MPALTREQFLKPAAVPVEEVKLPELGDDVYVNVHGMTAKERNAFESQFQTSSGKPNKSRMQEVRQRLVAACCRDESGARLFEPSDVDAIGEQSAAVVERIVNVAMRLCGMKDVDIEELAGN